MTRVTTDLSVDSDTGKRIAGNETTPLFEFANAGTGPGIVVDNLVVTSVATIATAEINAGVFDATTLNATDLIVTSGATISSNVTLAPALHVQNTKIQGATQATMILGVASTPSAPAIKLAGTAFVSCSSINFTTAALAGIGAIRVAHTDTDTLGWIPVLPDAMLDTIPWE